MNSYTQGLCRVSKVLYEVGLRSSSNLSNTTVAVTSEQFGYLTTEAVVIEQPQLTINGGNPAFPLPVGAPDQGSNG